MWAKSSTRYVRALGPRRRSRRCCGRDADPGPTVGREPPRLQPVRPWRLWAAPPDPGAAPPSPLVLARRLAGGRRRHPPRVPERGRGPPCSRRRPLPLRCLAPHCWRRPAGASRRVRPGRRGGLCAGGERAAPAPPPRPPGRGGSLAGRAPAAVSPPALPLGLRFFRSLHFVSVGARSPHGRPHSRPFVSRALCFLRFPARVCDRFRRGAFFLLPSHSGKAASWRASLQQVL